MEIKELNYKSLLGISEKQLKEHHDVLYAGYVKKLDGIRAELDNVSKEGANATYSVFRGLKLEETFALNAIRLHEFYFENLGGDGFVKDKIRGQIDKDFGSFELWKEDFIACGMSARGWVILAEDKDGKLYNYISDFHSHGGIWNAEPLLVLDVYEHAYFIDYGTKRKDYIEAFMKNVDWEVVEQRYKAAVTA